MFWWYPSLPHDYPYYWVILDPKSKEDKIKLTNLKNSPKFVFFLILKPTLHVTHILKFLDKMCTYEMDLTSIVEDTERTRFCPQTDRWTDRQMDRRTEGQGETSIPPFQHRWSRGITSRVFFFFPSLYAFPLLVIDLISPAILYSDQLFVKVYSQETIPTPHHTVFTMMCHHLSGGFAAQTAHHADMCFMGIQLQAVDMVAQWKRNSFPPEMKCPPWPAFDKRSKHSQQ